VVSLLAHAVLLVVAVLLSRPPPPPPPGRTIPWPPLHAGVRGGGGTQEKGPTKPTKANGRKTPRSVRPPVEVSRPADLPARSESDARNEVPGRDETGGADAAGPGGPGGGVGCATPPCGDGGGIFSEDVVADMPVLLAAPEIRLSQDAVHSGVEGTMLVRCVITAAGTVEGCEVLKGVPLAEAAVLLALQGRQYRPARIEGRAVSVRHLFTIRIRHGR